MCLPGGTMLTGKGESISFMHHKMVSVLAIVFMVVLMVKHYLQSKFG